MRTALEDFRCLDHTPAGEAFYGLVEWLNGPTSGFESNDCALTPLGPNDSPALDGALLRSGRLMILFRELRQNTEAARIHALTQATALGCFEADVDFAGGVVGLSTLDVHFRALPRSRCQGEQLVIHFWAAGHSERSVLDNLARTLATVSAVLRSPALQATAHPP